MRNQVNATITWLIKGVNASGGLPTRIANALNTKSTCVDLEVLFLVKNVRDMCDDRNTLYINTIVGEEEEEVKDNET